MEQVFEHNQQMLLKHMYAPQTLVDVIAIRHPPPAISMPDSLSPAFWKIMAVYQQCTKVSDAPHLVWFLDGDALIMDPTVRIEILWYYHQSKHGQSTSTSPLDILFAHGKNGYNSGIFVVNCTSHTALETLQLWHTVALDLMAEQQHDDDNEGSESFQNHVRPNWYEQNALHYMLDTHQWKAQGLISETWHPPRRPRIWDEHYEKYSYIWETNQTAIDKDAMRKMFSTRALQSRLRRTTQCALHTFPPTRASLQHHASSSLNYSPGHFILHTDGVQQSPRLAILKYYATAGDVGTGTNNHTLSLVQAAHLYLKNHPYAYDFNETYMDWAFPI
jgi:hypothetical protein